MVPKHWGVWLGTGKTPGSPDALSEAVKHPLFTYWAKALCISIRQGRCWGCSFELLQARFKFARVDTARTVLHQRAGSVPCWPPGSYTAGAVLFAGSKEPNWNYSCFNCIMVWLQQRTHAFLVNTKSHSHTPCSKNSSFRIVFEILHLLRRLYILTVSSKTSVFCKIFHNLIFILPSITEPGTWAKMPVQHQGKCEDIFEWNPENLSSNQEKKSLIFFFFLKKIKKWNSAISRGKGKVIYCIYCPSSI